MGVDILRVDIIAPSRIDLLIFLTNEALTFTASKQLLVGQCKTLSW